MRPDWSIESDSGVFEFGSWQSGFQFAGAPEIGPPDGDYQDSTRSGADGAVFGADTLAGTTISFELHILGSSPADALAKLSRLRTVWRGDGVRRTPGAVVALRTHTGRVAFGRPRRFAPDLSLLGQKTLGVTLDFATEDDLWYDDEESLTVPLGLSQSGGFTFPLRFPMVARGSTSRTNTFQVGGELPTWTTLLARGPILNPVLEVAGRFRYAAAMSLAYDEWLSIDTRRGVVQRNGSQIAALTRSSSFLEDGLLDPGKYTFTLSGSSSTGNPTAAIAWRPAFPTP